MSGSASNLLQFALSLIIVKIIIEIMFAIAVVTMCVFFFSLSFQKQRLLDTPFSYYYTFVSYII